MQKEPVSFQQAAAGRRRTRAVRSRHSPRTWRPARAKPPTRPSAVRSPDAIQNAPEQPSPPFVLYVVF